MSTRTTEVTDTVWRFLLEQTVHEPELLGRLRAETAAMPSGGMQISPEQGRFMAFLVELIGARRCLEIGVFTGYSSLVTALALPADGRIVACDVSEEFTAVARRYWEEAGVAAKVDLRLAPALGTLRELLAGGAQGSFDFAFIDADKENYDAYYEHCLTLLRQNGLIVVDNALWAGKVADPDDGRETTRAIRALDIKACADPRVSATLVPIGDGVLLARKR
jgi:predicted O-methyltransferase YrrM